MKGIDRCYESEKFLLSLGPLESADSRTGGMAWLKIIFKAKSSFGDESWILMELSKWEGEGRDRREGEAEGEREGGREGEGERSGRGRGDSEVET